jgi:hypothetical protein
MKEINDLRKPTDIPNIERFVDLEFKLLHYCKGDNVQFYRYEDEEKGLWYNLDLVNDNQLILGSDSFWDLICGYEDLQYMYFCVSIGESDIIESYDYRPLVEDSEKNFIEE